jgi:hypothetical protein
MKQIAARIDRFRITAVIVIVLALLGTGLSIIAMNRRPDTPNYSDGVPDPPKPTAPSPAVWTDPSTRLMWTAKDNGQNVNWSEATNFCANLNNRNYGGYSSGWRLPEIRELEALYDPSVTKTYIYHGPPWRGFEDGGPYKNHIKNLDLDSCCAWSKTRDGALKAYYLRFHSPQLDPFSYRIDGMGVVRALCVRSPN